MRFRILLILTMLNTCYAWVYSQEIDNKCVINVNEGMLELKQIEGVWIYQYSLTDDTCFIVENTPEVPCHISYKICADSIELLNKNKNVYLLRKDNIFQDLCVETLVNKKDRITETYYPTGTLMKTGKESYIKVFNYGVNKKFVYYIMGLNSEALILRDEKVYTKFGKKHIKVKHIYKRNVAD